MNLIFKLVNVGRGLNGCNHGGPQIERIVDVRDRRNHNHPWPQGSYLHYQFVHQFPGQGIGRLLSQDQRPHKRATHPGHGLADS